MDITDALIAHWGSPDRNARFATGSSLVEVLKYDAQSTNEGVVIYATATSGPSASGHLNEFVLGLDVAHDEVADPLARLCVFARTTPVHHGDSVPIKATLGADGFIDELRRQGFGFWDSTRPALSKDIHQR